MLTSVFGGMFVVRKSCLVGSRMSQRARYNGGTKKIGDPKERERDKKNLLSSMPALFAESNPTPNDTSNEAPASNDGTEGWGRWKSES